MYQNIISTVLITFLIFVFFAVPVAAAQEDPCSGEGIVVRNATMLDLWFKGKSGECFIWVHEHLLTIGPANSIGIYSDMNCETLYCEENPTYKDYQSVDANGNCRVRILPGCHLADM